MGAINYKTSDYITLAIRPYKWEDFTEDFTEDEISQAIQDCYECDYDNVKYELEKHDFYFYHVRIVPGYYEGFSLDIENSFTIAYNDYIEKRQAQKEITELKEFLLKVSGMGLQVCFPGWVTSFKNDKETIIAIKQAIKDIRQESKNTPTWLWYERDQYK